MPPTGGDFESVVTEKLVDYIGIKPGGIDDPPGINYFLLAIKLADIIFPRDVCYPVVK